MYIPRLIITELRSCVVIRVQQLRRGVDIVVATPGKLDGTTLLGRISFCFSMVGLVVSIDCIVYVGALFGDP